LISEELGMAGPINAPWAVVMDPLDGSLNAKRGLEPFCASIAIAKGETLEDVAIAYIEDYTRRRCFAAVKGAGLLRAGTPLRTPVTPDPDAEVLNIGGVDKLFAIKTIELVLLEAGRPDSHNFRFNDLSVMDAAGRSPDMRVRQIGSLALSLCYVAVGIADILIAAVRSRSVDVAAGFLILAEAGGGVAALTDCDIWTQPLDLEKRCGFVAWRAGLDEADIISRSRDLGRVLLIGA
jgi:myo-inositol-1(or 4)-monophosphatase